MAKIFHKPYNINLPKSQHEVEEFKSKKGLIICPEGGEVYYRKRWHHGLNNLPVATRDWPVKHALCPAHQMIKNKQYEGRVTVKNLPVQYSEKLEKLVEGFSRRAYDRDPMDRLIEMKKVGSDWIITTTENEMANKLARKIKDSFNKIKSRTKFAAEPSDVAEVVMDFGLMKS